MSSNRRRHPAIAVLIVTMAIAPGAAFAARLFKDFYLGQPVTHYQLEADEMYNNCYYGDDGNGHPTGVSSIAVGDSCGEGGSSCIGTMHACDCLMQLYEVGCN